MMSASVRSGEMVGIVGESGCGKSVMARSIMRLIPNPPGRIVGGEIRFRGTNLLELSEAAMQKIRGKDISMIFQEPMTSLNPAYTVGTQLGEVFKKHQKVKKQEDGNREGFPRECRDTLPRLFWQHLLLGRYCSHSGLGLDTGRQSEGNGQIRTGFAL